MNPCLPITPPDIANPAANGVWGPEGLKVLGKAVKAVNKKPKPKQGKTSEKPKICP